MNRTILRFPFLGMPVKAKISVIPAGAGMALVIGLIALFGLRVPPVEALSVALRGVFLYAFSAIMHQYGHFMMARLSGYPSTGLVMWGLLGTTTYPHDEGELAPRIHIMRASGGPLMSLLLSVLILIALNTFPLENAAGRFLMIWFAFENSVVFFLGSLIPPIVMGDFRNDGAIIARELHRMRS